MPKEIVDSYMKKVSGIKEHCERCLRTERWGGSVVLMVVDAAFTSIGLNYFTAVVPKIDRILKTFGSIEHPEKYPIVHAKTLEELLAKLRNLEF